MPNSLKESQRFEQKESDEGLVWTVHLARHEPGKFAVCLLACFIAAVIGYAVFKNPFPVIITLAVLMAAISDFLLPVTYRLSPVGASSTSMLFRRSLRWEEIKACYVDESGIKLSPIGYPTRRETFHGVYLRFGDMREEVIRTVQALRKNADD